MFYFVVLIHTTFPLHKKSLRQRFSFCCISHIISPLLNFFFFNTFAKCTLLLSPSLFPFLSFLSFLSLSLSLSFSLSLFLSFSLSLSLSLSLSFSLSFSLYLFLVSRSISASYSLSFLSTYFILNISLSFLCCSCFFLFLALFFLFPYVSQRVYVAPSFLLFHCHSSPLPFFFLLFSSFLFFVFSVLNLLRQVLFFPFFRYLYQ